MSLLKNLATDDSIKGERDSVGGGGVVESGLYPSVIELAYLTTSSGGAIGLVLQAKAGGGQKLRQTLWMTSGSAKGCKNYYEKDGEKTYLPGFLLANSLALLTVGKEISELDTEQKVVSAYSAEAKAEVPTKVEMLTDLLGKEVILGVIKQTVDKTKKNDTTGVYEATGETRDENELDKVFRASDNKTTAEILAQAEEAAFHAVWKAKWTGVTKNKAKGASAGGGAPGAPKAAAKAPAKSLFG